MTEHTEESGSAVAGPRQSSLLANVLRATRPTGEDHQVTTFELFFDLVCVFALTQVTHFMAEEHSAYAVLQGLAAGGELPSAAARFERSDHGPRLVGCVETRRYSQIRHSLRGA